MMHKSNNDTDVCDVTACFSIGIQVKVWSTVPTVVLVQNHSKNNNELVIDQAIKAWPD